MLITTGSATTTSTTLAGSTTTSTTVPAGCVSAAACVADLAGALPSPATAADKHARRTARALQKLLAKLRKLVARAALTTGKRHAAKDAAACKTVQTLLGIAQQAVTGGTLGVPLSGIQGAVGAVRTEIPCSS